MATKIILTCRVEDHVSPLLKAISDAHFARPADLPPFPPNPVSIESGIGSGDPFVCMRPSRELLAWVYAVLAAGEQINVSKTPAAEMPRKGLGGLDLLDQREREGLDPPRLFRQVVAKVALHDCGCSGPVTHCPRTACPRGLNR